MISNNRHRVLVWSVVVLAILNISTLATIAYHIYQTKQIAQDSGNIVTKSLETNTEQFSGRYFRDNIGFNSDQMNHFREFNPVFRQQAMDITLKLAECRKLMLDEMVRKQSDTIRLNELSDEIGKLHSRLKVLTYKYYIDMKKICTPEQQVKLEQLFRSMFNTDAQMGFPGGGKGRHGMGQGWKHNN